MVDSTSVCFDLCILFFLWWKFKFQFPMADCKNCNKGLDPAVKPIVCYSCTGIFCKACSKLSATELRVFELNTPMLKFICSSCLVGKSALMESVCSRIMEEILETKLANVRSDIESGFQKLKTEINSLKKEYSVTLSDVVGSVSVNNAEANVLGSNPKGPGGYQRQQSTGRSRIASVGSRGSAASLAEGGSGSLRENRIGPGSGFSRKVTDGAAGRLTPPSATQVPNKDYNTSKRKVIIGTKQKVPAAQAGSVAQGPLFIAAKKPLPKTASIHVYRVAAQVTAESLKLYLNQAYPSRAFEVEQLQSRNAWYSSFKVDVEYDILANMLAPEFWPEGIAVRRFVHGRNSNFLSQNQAQPVAVRSS